VSEERDITNSRHTAASSFSASVSSYVIEGADEEIGESDEFSIFYRNKTTTTVINHVRTFLINDE
jgi:hypothetical protein